MKTKLGVLNKFSRYLFYSDGRVYDKENDDFVRTVLKGACGYLYVKLKEDGGGFKEFRHHILICKAFNGDKPFHNSVVGHYNNIKTDNNADNLYWTTTKENSRKSWEDGCSSSKNGDENKASVKIKVIDSKTNEIVGVYGSIKECVRCVSNVTDTFIGSVRNKGLYKTRSKKYIYNNCSEEEYRANKDKQKAILIENEKVDKRPTVFKVEFLDTGEVKEFDNQSSFAKEHGFFQSQISSFIANNLTVNNMKFSLVKKIKTKDSSVYDNILKNIDVIVVENIFTKETIEFKTANDLKKHFDLRSNDVRGTYKDNLIHSEWRIL